MKLTTLIVQNADVLRRLARDPAPASQAALAAELKRDPSNLSKSISHLDKDGLIARDRSTRSPVPTLTDLGREAVAALDRAETGEAADALPDGWALLHSGQIEFDPNNARSRIDAEGLEALANSIAERGLQQNLVVRPPLEPNGHWRLIAGERRLRAIQMVQERGEWPKGRRILCKIEQGEDLDADVAALHENLQREDLHPLDEAAAYKRLADVHGLGTAEIAARVKRSQRHVQDRLRFTDLREDLKHRMRLPEDHEHHLTPTAVRQLLNAPRPKAPGPEAAELTPLDRTATRMPAEPDNDVVGGLSGTPEDALFDKAWEAVRAFDAAVFDGDDAAIKAAKEAYAAVIYALNGGTNFGCNAGPGSPVPRVKHYCAAPAGETLWGQSGEFLLEVEGMRILVVIDEGGVFGTPHAELYAVDLDKPFLSETGYRSVHYDLYQGLRPREAIGEIIRASFKLAKDPWKAKPIEPQYRDNRRKVLEGRPWLAELLGDTPATSEPASTGPAQTPMAPTRHRFSVGGGLHDPRRQMEQRAAEQRELEELQLSPHERLGLVELAHKLQSAPVAGYSEPHALTHQYWLDGVYSSLAKHGLVRIIPTGQGQLAVLSLKGGKKLAMERPGKPAEISELELHGLRSAVGHADWPANGGYVTTFLQDPPETPFPLDGGRAGDEGDEAGGRALPPPPDLPEVVEALQAALRILIDTADEAASFLDASLDLHAANESADDAIDTITELRRAIAVAEDAMHQQGAPDYTCLDAPGETPIAELVRQATQLRPVTDPAVPIRKSITPDHIVCLEDGRKFKCLKRHLRTRYNLSPDQYRARWGLPRDYPMVAPNYAQRRAELAKAMGVNL